jgi:hypothetical protein
MPLTLIEAAQQAFNRGEERVAEIIMQFAESSLLMQALTWQKISGNAITFPREERLPNIGWRGINEGYLEDAGEVIRVTESTKIFGGYLDVDISLERAFGAGIRSSRENMKVRSLTLEFDKVFVKGDITTNPKEFPGLQKRCTGTQLIPAGNTSGGDALSLSVLDRAKKRTRRPTHWIMSQDMSLRLVSAARTTGVAGFVTYTSDQFGQDLTTYAGLPIIELESDNMGNPILNFNEANPGGGTPASTSIYCVSFGLGMLQGIHNMASDAQIIDVKDLGERENVPVKRTRVESELGIAMMDGRSATRIWGIKDVPIVA